MASEARRIRKAAGDVNTAKQRAQYTLEHLDTLPDGVNASFSDLERAIELLGSVERELDDAADAFE